jgi:hypothetical protein
MSKYTIVRSQLNDFKSQAKLVLTNLKLSNSRKVYLKISTLHNIIAREFNYTSISELNLKADVGPKFAASLPLYDLVNLKSVAECIIKSDRNITLESVDESLKLLTSHKCTQEQSEDGVFYPFINELKDLIDGKLSNQCLRYTPCLENFGTGEAQYYKYLQATLNAEVSHDFDRYSIIYETDSSIGLFGGDATIRLKTLEQLECLIGLKIKQIRAGSHGESWAYLNGILLDITHADIEDIVNLSPPLNTDSKEIEGLEDSVLIGYCETHNSTPRALFSGEQLRRLRYLSGSLGMPIIDINDDDFICNKPQVSRMVLEAKKVKDYFLNS